MPLVQNRQEVTIEAGEVHVKKNDVIVPSKLKMMANAGWSIHDAIDVEDGFILLLTRNVGPAPGSVNLGVHEGTSRCPDYCNCLTANL